MRLIHLLVQPDFKPGDPAPTDYLGWHEWAEVQHKAGLRQAECGRCGLWRFPQQLGPVADEFEAKSFHRKPPRVRVWRCYSPVCLDCLAKAASQ